MTQIARIGAGPSPTRRVARASGGFALPADAAPEAPLAAAVAGTGSLLAMQEQAPIAPTGERARQRARATLDELRGLQLDLLRDGADPARLERLATLGEAAGAADPVFAEIGLRARIELARHHAALRRRSAGLPGRSASAM